MKLVVTINQVEDENIKNIIQAIPQTLIDEYSNYWDNIAPVTDEEYYNRWVFAFLSVHTSWSSNVKGYLSLAEAKYPDKETLYKLIQESGVGLSPMRTKGIWKFKESFERDPSFWKKRTDETWVQFRDRTADEAHGIALAKTAFAIEMCYPTTCEVVCLDTHMLQLYKAKTETTPSPSKYKTLEQHWINACKSRNIPPFIARNIFWDKVQKQSNSTYWSHVFERNKVKGQSNMPETSVIKQLSMLQPVTVQNLTPALA